MDTPYRVQRVLCQAQYGDILLCRLDSETCRSDEGENENQIGPDADLVVVKQISWPRLQGSNNCERAAAATLQASDDPMLEVDIAAKICAAGNHKNVVQYHKVLRGDRGSFGIVMEYCNEGDLLKRLDQLPGNRMPEVEALTVLREIANGLDFLHNTVGVAHRDVSLENVMVRDGVCKIGDFGLSTHVHLDRTAHREEGNLSDRVVEGRVGKLGYMAPEVAAGHPYDPFLADVWSMGVSFFILLTGSPLIEMASVDCPGFRAFRRLGLRRVLTDWKMIDDFHEETINLAERMLEVDPHNRIPLQAILRHSAFDLPSL
jgi:serine/threonine protein kinase